MSQEKVLVLGAGGREHAICWHLKKKGFAVECSPGSQAISSVASCWEFTDFTDLQSQIKKRGIQLVIVGPEKYLDEGVADFLGDIVFGPSKQAALLETSKTWAKEFCFKNKIPAARSVSVSQASQIEENLSEFRAPYVVKASGLAAGKGVLVTPDKAKAKLFAEEALKTHDSVLLEDFLEGEEASCFYLVDGENYCFLGTAQDHKRLLNNDEGPNTGGMGAYSPAPLVDQNCLRLVEERILKPSLKALRREKIYYKGFMFLGLMVQNTEPFLLEYNCRMGDPETQALMLRLKSSLPELIKETRTNESVEAEFVDQTSLSVVLAAKGYPDAPEKGALLKGLDKPTDDLIVFHAGTETDENGVWRARGGRLASVCTTAESLEACQKNVYSWISTQDFSKEVHYRTDIGSKSFHPSQKMKGA